MALVLRVLRASYLFPTAQLARSVLTSSRHRGGSALRALMARSLPKIARYVYHVPGVKLARVGSANHVDLVMRHPKTNQGASSAMKYLHRTTASATNVGTAHNRTETERSATRVNLGLQVVVVVVKHVAMACSKMKIEAVARDAPSAKLGLEASARSARTHCFRTRSAQSAISGLCRLTLSSSIRVAVGTRSAEIISLTSKVTISVARLKMETTLTAASSRLRCPRRVGKG